MNFDGTEIGKKIATAVRSSSSLRGKQQASNPLRAGAEQKSFDRRDVKGHQVRTAKCTVGWTATWDGVHLEYSASRRKHVDHGARPSQFPPGGGDDIAFLVQAHAIDPAMLAEIVEDLGLSQSLAGFHGICA